MYEGKECMPMEQKTYDNFLDIYKSLKGSISASGGSYEKLEWDCSSNYLYISLLSLIILLL